jgi:hypothetical protein
MADTGNKLGLSEQQKFDVKKPLRSETNEKSQRPASKTESVKTDRGSFKMKG